MAQARDTIFALGTLTGRSGLSVVRVSGPGARAAATLLAGSLPAPRRAGLRRFRDPETGEVIDRGLVVYFPEPHSLTGETVVEFHLHGGRAVAASMIGALARLSDLRPAEPGEFTRRAFLNGKLDLTAVEGLADLIDAETEAQRRQAMRQADGELGRLYETWREELVSALAHLEAVIDFPEDELDPALARDIEARVKNLCRSLGAHLSDSHRGELLRAGFTIAIMGAPNSGKSSLINSLAKRDVAIVAATAGTTRDVIEVTLDLKGYPVTIADTAGLHAAADAIEAEGIARALKRAGAADAKLVLFDATALPALDEASVGLIDARSTVVITKTDLAAPPTSLRLPVAAPRFAISTRTGEGLAALVEHLAELAQSRMVTDLATPSLTRARHRLGLEEALNALERFDMNRGSELAAEELRLAMRALGRVTGAVDVEELLDVIFRDFCLGK